MRWCAALAVVLVALVVMTVRTIRRPHRHPPAIDPESAELAPPPPAPPTASFSPVVRRESSGIAHLRGRVLFPAGERGTDDDIYVMAEDGTRKIDARVAPDGGYQLHLPSGRYTLIASAGELVGVVPDVLARAGATHDIDIRLGVGAAIKGKLRTPGGVVVVSASLFGQDDDDGVPRVDDAGFSVGGLIPGRGYTLTFQGPGVRKLILAGVTAPAHGLDVELQARAEISGAIGFARGTLCPIDHVELQIDGKTVHDDANDDAVSATVGRDCSFSLAVPDQATAVTVVATGDGWHLEAQVAVPPRGDPEPICLNPPCRSDPREGLARLRITLEGADTDSQMSADVEPVSDADRSTHSCGGSHGRCDVEGLLPGTAFTVTGHTLDCHTDPIQVTVVAGDNSVRLACHRRKQIEGVLRTPDGEPPGAVTVRCPDGTNDHYLSGSRLFAIVCKADAAAIEYQIGESGIWRRAPIASAADPAFVDIGL